MHRGSVIQARIALAVSAVALATALAGTPAGDAATRVVGKALFAGNAGAVNGIHASRTPRPGRLVPLDPNGQVPLSTLPAAAVNPNAAARVYSTVNQRVPLSAPGPLTPETLLLFDQVPIDTKGQFDVAKPDRLTVRVPGVYVLTAHVTWLADRNAGGAHRVVRILVNGNQVGVDQREMVAAMVDATSQSVATVVPLAAGDAVQVQVGASDSTMVVAGAGLPSLAMAWVAPG